MDQRGMKRPRGGDSVLDSKKPPVKKKQKKTKTKKQSSTVSDKKDTAPANSLESTATAEGVTMTHVLSTFNRLEQSRFEAFRRCTFRGDAISSYVAHCLEACQERAHARSKTLSYLGNPTTQKCPFVKNAPREKRSLQDMVAPDQADEITVVVSTLAKAFAQRLVTAARRVANSADRQALLPEHVRQAHLDRVQAGLEPGFFLQACRSVNHVGVDNTKHELQWNAALAAQEEYDKYMEEQKSLQMDDTEQRETVQEIIMQEVDDSNVSESATAEQEEPGERAKVSKEAASESAENESDRVVRSASQETDIKMQETDASAPADGRDDGNVPEDEKNGPGAAQEVTDDKSAPDDIPKAE